VTNAAVLGWPVGWAPVAHRDEGSAASVCTSRKRNVTSSPARSPEPMAKASIGRHLYGAVTRRRRCARGDAYDRNSSVSGGLGRRMFTKGVAAIISFSRAKLSPLRTTVSVFKSVWLDLQAVHELDDVAATHLDHGQRHDRVVLEVVVVPGDVVLGVPHALVQLTVVETVLDHSAEGRLALALQELERRRSWRMASSSRS
jgi:hypothetical protein